MFQVIGNLYIIICIILISKTHFICKLYNLKYYFVFSFVFYYVIYLLNQENSGLRNTPKPLN